MGGWRYDRRKQSWQRYEQVMTWVIPGVAIGAFVQLIVELLRR